MAVENELKMQNILEVEVEKMAIKNDVVMRQEHVVALHIIV